MTRSSSVGVLLLLLLSACAPPAPPGPKIETKRAKAERGDNVLHVSATGEIKPVKEVGVMFSEFWLVGEQTDVEASKVTAVHGRLLEGGMGS